MKKILPLIGLLIALDQISKYFVTKMPSTISLLGDFFQIEYSQNFGVIFGLPMPKIIIILFALILIPTLTYFFRKDLDWQKPITKLVYALIIAGALGNLIDRFTYGFVVDFIAIGSWPNFNFADTYITLGVLTTIIFYSRLQPSRK
ncbi:signal peptidase II [Candidatus Gracilibacteria bacterium]|nr:signal peptidase II [Candidatus Gracilibacteria bacterium]